MPRYDQFVIFFNHSNQDFVGRYSSEDGEVEDYLIPAGGKELYPTWLANHFAKRLCDREMILKHKRPLRSDDPKRIEFIAKCLIDPKADGEPKAATSFKQQIEEDRKRLLRDSSGKFSKKQLETGEKREAEEVRKEYAETLKGPKVQRRSLATNEGNDDLGPVEFTGSPEGADSALQGRIPKP